MNKRPFGIICIFFISGIILAGFIPDNIFTWLGCIFFITLGFICFKYDKISNICLFLSISLFGSLLYINSNVFPDNHISRFFGKDPVRTSLVGIIKSPANTRGSYFGRINSNYLFEIEAISDLADSVSRRTATHGVSGLALLRIQTEKDYQYGDRLLVKGVIKRPSQPKSKNDFNYRRFLENEDIFAIITANEKGVTLLAHDYKSNPVLRYAYIIREKIKSRIIEKMPLKSGSFLRAILLGDRSELPKSIQNSFRDSGTMHILAISGLNVTLIAAALIYLLKFLRLKREFYYIFTIIFLSFLALLTGGTPSVVRATVMVNVFLVGMLLGRSIDPYNSLGIAALFILIRNPKDIFDVGFQLSFLAVFSMFYFAPRIMPVIKKEMNPYFRKYLYMPLAVSVSASIGTFPLILYYFRLATPISIISNIFIVPAMFILMIGGLAFAAAGWVNLLGDFLALFNNIFSEVIFFLADFFAGFKFGHFYI